MYGGIYCTEMCTEIPDGNVWGHIYAELRNDDPVCPSTAPEDVT